VSTYGEPTPPPSRFSYVKYDDSAVEKQAAIKSACEHVEALINELPDSRHTRLALDKLEETYMWCGKAIRDDQWSRTKSAPAQEERSNG
jgi:hypothetical protein